MVSLFGLNFNNAGIPFGVKHGNTLVDQYNKFSEKKDEYVAVMIANDKKSDKRASATAIGAYGSLLWTFAKLGINALRHGKAYKNPVLDFFLNGVNYYKDFMQKYNIGRIPILNKALGIGTYIGVGIAYGAALGYLFDLYGTARNTIVNGKISNTKSGVNGSWIQSGLKSLSATPEGKEIIKNSIRKNDDNSVTVRFNGIDKEYTITKKELKDASRSYVTYKSDDGQNVVGFKKKFSKGDGDVLAFEVAFEKYCQDINSGAIKEDKRLPKSMQSLSDTGDILYTNGSASQLYYLLTGKDAKNINLENKDLDEIMKLYTKTNIKHFKEDFQHCPKDYAVELTLKHPEDKKELLIRDKYMVLHKLSTNNQYTVSDANEKYITLANANETNDKIVVPFSNVEKYISELNYVKVSK
ncbi:MAG: hypothetical protein K6E29_00825 [Cyanobacteria bacterium RUI128]|nr:hypothetical protein [Cyanobacteria bacterium RUI128]